MIRVLARLLTAAALAAVVLALHRLGDLLPAPPLAPDELGAWVARQGAATAAFGVLRLAALALGWYATALATVAFAARATGSLRALRLVDGAAVGPLRPLLNGLFVAGLTTATIASTGAAVAAEPRHDPAVTVDATPGTATMRRLPGESAGTTESAPQTPVAAPAPSQTWEVRPGDHLWGIAERTLAEAWRRRPRDSEITPYWRAVVDANRPQLADPANPDLLFAGQTIALPPPPPPAR